MMKTTVDHESAGAPALTQQLSTGLNKNSQKPISSKVKAVKTNNRFSFITFSFLPLFCLMLISCKDDEAEIPQPIEQPVVANKISGTINAVSGENVAGTYVIACFNNDCEDEQTKYVQLSQQQPSASFEITDLAEGQYSIVAWKDNNTNNELDAGDGIGIVSANGNDPDLITPPKEGIALQMVVMEGSGGSTGGAGSISGTIAAPASQGVDGTVVIACQWNGTECVETTSQAVQVQANSTYAFSGLASEVYFIIAWKDLNNNEDIDEGDFFGIHVKDGSIGSVLPPSQDINVAMAIKSNQDNAGGGGNGSVPANLVGDWIRGTAGAVDFYNSTTGSWSAPSGTGMYLQLFSDGSYVLNTVVQVTNYNCTTQVTTYYSGRAIFNNDQLTLEPDYTRQKFNSNCFTQHNSDKVVPNSPLPFSWRSGTDANGQQELVLIWPDGVESAFSRP